jgi:hypothetical protein
VELVETHRSQVVISLFIYELILFLELLRCVTV